MMIVRGRRSLLVDSLFFSVILWLSGIDFIFCVYRGRLCNLPCGERNEEVYYKFDWGGGERCKLLNYTRDRANCILLYIVWFRSVVALIRQARSRNRAVK